VNGSGASVSVRNLFFAGVFLLALGLRLGDLGATPLNDDEARDALWAAAGTPEQSAFWPSHRATPASSAVYQSVTWAIFQLAGGGEAAARFFPAVVGALIVLPPWLLRRRLGTLGALMVALLLAISPTLIAVSRLAGGSSAAIVAVALGVAGWILVLDGEMEPRRATALLAGCLAVGLTAGPAFFFGLITLAGAAGLTVLTTPRAWPPERAAGLRAILPRAIALGVGGAVAIALVAGWLPSGITSLAEGARTWLVGWLGPSQMHPLTPLAILLVYEPLVVVFGVAGAVVAFRARDALGAGGAWWAILGLILVAVYPARTGVGVAWIVLPLTWLAGGALAKEGERLRRLPSPWEAVGVGALLLFLLIYAGLQLSSYAHGVGPSFAPLTPNVRLTVAVGAVVVAGLAAVLIGFGWSWSVARSGMALAGAAALMMLAWSSGWRLNYFRENVGAGELWAASAPTGGLTRLTSTMGSLSMSERGVPNELPIAIEDSTPPASLIWALRAFPRFTTSDSGVPESPPVVVARETGVRPALAADYLGQAIALKETWDFPGPIPPDLLGWWWRRRLPVEQTTWLLLVRADVATHGESEVGQIQP